ncbi:carbon storage regulator [Allorhodopirellula heiligendammensis]|uniref:Translational regulator CsrA n=1 Tax=Allorhodopirellula heiligendammensis TaxID=2714739 RepID=A0A5C6C4Q5_9BACT|nr:carbon storage regulator [Allorhodopirellula heiligendammensis]TWU19533.1 Carbon storage regulator [Allorhodopirellula heiligendammensis]
MLVLSRRVGETILIGNGVQIAVTRIQGKSVTIGVVAPDEVKVLRGEIENKSPRRSEALRRELSRGSRKVVRDAK